VNTFIENCTDWWAKKPSRVPGRRHTARSRLPISRGDIAGSRSGASPGASRTTTTASTLLTDRALEDVPQRIVLPSVLRVRDSTGAPPEA
jgi:hypothetical protein